MASWRSLAFGLLVCCALLCSDVHVTALTLHRPSYLSQRKMRSAEAGYGPTPMSGRNYRGKVVAVETKVLCDDGTAKTEWVDAILITRGGGCSQGRQALRAQSLGAVGLLVTDDGVGSEDEAEVDIPVERISKNDYASIMVALNNNIVVEATLGIPLNVLRYGF
ncbi:unnamed protein product [Trypanosoma congolense IL3000]|uniref:WGS project CAEQ00000000 data, annotated contig 1590 n=1 Tax=Trypanosoma congolense (strain IL3000) TaxID=1068625 RepID=F9W7A2_TRYCI|nr:unnamed protein product [Trypanosoma congolense IL3000]